MKVTRTCPVCQRKYKADTQRLKFGRQTTCSRKCSYEFRARKLTTSVLVICAVCGKQFKRSPTQIKSKHKSVYCSAACQYAGRGLGLTKRIVSKPYVITEAGRIAHKGAAQRGALTRKKNGNSRHSEETVAKLREATTKRIMSGKIKRVSKIEYVVAQKFTDLGIVFIQQYGIRDPKTGRYTASLDFFLPEQNIAIEVNGTFWHADPRFYDASNLSPAQRRTVKGYAKKIDVLRELGIELREIWEHDLRQSVDNAVKSVLAGIIA